MTRQERFVALASPFQGFQLAGDVNFAVCVIKPDIQRNHADRIAGNQEGVFLRVIEHEGEYPAEFFQEIRSLFAIQCQDDLAVASCLEIILPGISPTDLLVVVDFAIHGQHQFPIRRKQGLPARFRIDDAQALMGQDRTSAAPDAAPVRTAMTDPATHFQGLPAQGVRLFLNIENTYDSTHN